MERRSFEDNLKDAFKGAEKQPNESVWTNIELSIEKNSSEKVRRRLLFYQILAAASVTFALLTVGVGYYYFNERLNSFSIAQAEYERNLNAPRNSEATVIEPNTQSSADAITEQHSLGANPRSAESFSPAIAKNTYDRGRIDQMKNDHLLIGVGEYRDSDQFTAAESGNILNPRQLQPLYESSGVRLNFDKQEETPVDPVAKMFAELSARENELAKETNEEKKKSTKETLWTSVGFAAGGYNPGNPSVSAVPSSGNALADAASVAYTNAVNSQASASGVSYSFGVSMGKRLAGHWVLQSGVNYLNNNSEYVSNTVVASQDFKNFKAASLADLRSSSNFENNVLQTAEHKVNSSVEYLSVPVQAGYIAVDKKVGIQVNAGLSTDLFIQNTIDPNGSSLQRTQVSRGSDSPYRSTNFSGLMSTDFSYRFASRYRVSLSPGLRYPFNSIYKQQSGITSTPLIFDVGLRFRYIFN